MSTLFYACDGSDTSIVKDVTDLQPGDNLDGTNATVINPPKEDAERGLIYVEVRDNKTGMPYIKPYTIGEYELVVSPLLV